MKHLIVYHVPGIPRLVPGTQWLAQMWSNWEQVDQMSGSVNYIVDLWFYLPSWLHLRQDLRAASYLVLIHSGYP